MTTDDELLEALSAWTDGELPDDQARFLRRRLDADPALRARWERWQIASACLRGQAVRGMPATLAPSIAAAIAGEARPRRRRVAWVAAAAAAVLVALLLPARPVLETAPPTLVAVGPAGVTAPVADARTTDDSALAGEVATAASPPLLAVTAFPLAESAARPWPRSPLATDDSQLEAYLVGHNTLMAEDGVAGFMPYVDVVVQDGAVAADTRGMPEDGGR